MVSSVRPPDAVRTSRTQVRAKYFTSQVTTASLNGVAALVKADTYDAAGRGTTVERSQNCARNAGRDLAATRWEVRSPYCMTLVSDYFVSSRRAGRTIRASSGAAIAKRKNRQKPCGAAECSCAKKPVAAVDGDGCEPAPLQRTGSSS